MPLPAESLAWLFSRQRFGVKPGLGTIRALLAALGHPERAFDAVLVGGTNGKGSTAATLASVLHAAGRHEALFTSPHLTHVGERFCALGGALPDAAVRAALAGVRPDAERLGATFFEIVTALACLLFAEVGVDIAVMEVGLGGRFDATNALEPVLSIITGIGHDHMAILGDTTEQIAREKAGIMRPARVCLTGATGVALATLQQQAAALGADLWMVGETLQVRSETRGLQGITVCVESPLGALTLQSPLVGLHQARNVALAAVAGQLLAVDEASLQHGVARTRWPGRLEPVPYRGRTFLLDGAHNPEAAGALAAALRDLGLDHALFVFGMSADKDRAGVAAALDPLSREVILTLATLSPRAADPAQLRSYWTAATANARTPQEALDLAVDKSLPGEIIVVAGSLYLIGEVRPLLLGEPAEPYERWQ
ncbi:MAG TPA: folylpolyglutamate synthase/dihydrofolate synthase family protein [Trueperaceae bacterium]